MGRAHGRAWVRQPGELGRGCGQQRSPSRGWSSNARKIAYRISQTGRNALPDSAYAHVFTGAPIGEALAAELRRRRANKASVRHMDVAPRA